MPIKLKAGFTFFYKNKLYKVTEVYKIKWDDGTKSEEFKVKSKAGTINYLEIETTNDGKTIFSFWTKHSDKKFLEKSQKLVKDFVSLGSAKFPENLKYRGVDYIFNERNNGTCNYGYETERVNSLEYSNNENTKFLAIELWDDEIEVSTGIPIKEKDISKIEKGSMPVLATSIWNFFSKYFVALLIFGFLTISFMLEKCSKNNSWNNDSNYNSSDSTKVKRNNSYYRGRSSGGFGK
jgi:hypothetical protein